MSDKIGWPKSVFRLYETNEIDKLGVRDRPRYIRVRMSASKRIRIHIRIVAHVYVYMHWHMYMSSGIRTLAYVYTCWHTYTAIRIHIRMCTRTLNRIRKRIRIPLHHMCRHTHGNVYVYIGVYAYWHTVSAFRAKGVSGVGV